MAAAFVAGVFGASAVSADAIRIGVMLPMTGGLAQSGLDARNGFELYWNQVGNEAGGREVEIIVADTVCNPDNAINAARRLAFNDEVDFLVGPLCGHEGPAVAQVSGETGVPLLLVPAAADSQTKWDRIPTVIRTGFSSSQDAHPFGEYLYNELGLRNVTFLGQDYSYGQEKTLGAVATFEALGGTVDEILWAPLSTTDYAPFLASIPQGTEAVVPVVVGVHRNRFIETWFDFGYDRQFDLIGLNLLQADALVDMDDRVVGLISVAQNYSQGIDTPENQAFMDAYVEAYGMIPSYFAEMMFSTAMWAHEAIDSIDGNVEDRDVFLQAVRDTEIVGPRGPLRLDDYDNPIQTTYISRVERVDHPTLGSVLMNVPVASFPDVSQFWTWTPEEFLERGPYTR
ncbi:penicillin-binding protein activator [Boseongicola sp. H5]|uniref:ABC transporter substrate-binding protein n=1 Tax=Boseongicola sp. H5 TaxID=2763261 RepID=UPI002570D9B7|nr:penicillin-binding protein activator [Boseongicola sp. H5]